MNKGIYYTSFTAFLWGTLAIAIKVSLNKLPPLTVTWFRFTMAFILLLFYFLIFYRHKLKIIIKPPLFAIIAGICLGFNYIGYINGINLTTPSIGQIFIQAGPVLLAIAGFVLFKEKASIRQACGLVVVVTGLFIFYNEQIFLFSDSLEAYRVGVLWILFGAVAWAIYAVFQKKAVKNHNPMQLNLIIFGLPAFFLSPFVAYDKFADLSQYDWMLLVFLGLNTLGAYGSLAYALKYLEANKISVIITLNPIITFIIMALLSYNLVTWIQPANYSLITIAGAVAVVIGVILTVIKKKKI